MSFMETPHWITYPLLLIAGACFMIFCLFIRNKFFHKQTKLACVNPIGNGNLARIRVLNQELTTKEAALIQSDAKFRALIDYAPVFVGGFDKKGVPDLWNKECEKVFGYTKEEIIGNPNILKKFYPNEGDYVFLQKHLKKASGKFQEFTPKTKSGRKIRSAWANIILPDKSLISIGYKLQKVSKPKTPRTKK